MENINRNIAAIFEELNHPSNHLFELLARDVTSAVNRTLKGQQFNNKLTSHYILHIGDCLSRKQSNYAF